MSVTTALSLNPSRSTALAPAPPISDRIKQSIAFLFKVHRVEVVDTAADANGDACLVLNVIVANNTSAKADGLANVALATSAVASASVTAAVSAPATAATSEAVNISTTTLQIVRTFKELKELKRVVTHWSKKHVEVDARYGIPECAYCQHFYAHETTKHWPGGSLTRLATSKRTLEHKFERCVNDYVVHARLPRPSHLECQGFDHIPSIVARFLLKELPMPM